MKRSEFDGVMKVMQQQNSKIKQETKSYKWQDEENKNNFTIVYDANERECLLKGVSLPYSIVKYIMESSPKDAFYKNYGISIDNCKKRNINNKSMLFCDVHVITKEGLIILLTELQKYYLNKNYKGTLIDKKVDELLDDVEIETIKRTIKNIEENKDFIKNSIWPEEMHNNLFNITFNKLLKEFTKAVNPWLNEEFETIDIKEALDNVEIDTLISDCYVSDDYVLTNPYFNILIRDQKVKNYICCQYGMWLDPKNVSLWKENKIVADELLFTYSLKYKRKDGKNVKLIYSNSNISDKDPCFMWILQDKTSIINSTIDSLVYNLKTQQKSKYIPELNYEPITNKDKLFICQELCRGIEYAKKITINNLGKKETSKILKK